MGGKVDFDRFRKHKLLFHLRLGGFECGLAGILGGSRLANRELDRDLGRNRSAVAPGRLELGPANRLVDQVAKRTPGITPLHAAPPLGIDAHLHAHDPTLGKLHTLRHLDAGQRLHARRNEILGARGPREEQKSQSKPKREAHGFLYHPRHGVA